MANPANPAFLPVPEVKELPPKFTPDNRVNYDWITWAQSQFVCEATYVPHSTLTIVSVFFEGFHLADGTSSCVDPLNYNQVIGHDIATKNALQAAQNKLWELCGWELHNHLKQTNKLVDPSKLPNKSNSAYSRYPALRQLESALASYNGTTISQRSHEANLALIGNTGKAFNGHPIYMLGNAYRIILSASDVNGQQFLYIDVPEMAMYELEQLRLDSFAE